MRESSELSVERLRWLHRLTDAVARAREPAEIHAFALECLEHVLGAPRSSILLFDEAGVMRFRAWRGLSEGYRAAVDGHSPWKLGDVDPEPVWVEDVELDEPLAAYRPVFRAEEIRALGFVPLCYGGRLLGKFMIYYREPHRFDAVERQLAQILAGHVALAVERRRSEVALRHARDELDTVLSRVADGITATDGRGRFLYVNDAAARMMGFSSREEVLALPTPEVLARFEVLREGGEPFPLTELPTRIALLEGREASAFLQFRTRPSSEDRWSYVTATPVLGESGEVRFVVNIFRDVTEERRGRRLLEASEERARLAYAAAKEAERRKDQFLAILGHELRNPLAPIATAIRLIEQRGTARSPELLPIMKRQVAHLQRLVDDLLDVSRITRGKLELKKERVEIADVVDKALELAEPLLAERGQRLEVTVPRSLPVLGDPIRLAQVLTNLLSNAARYSHDGSLIRVTAERRGQMAALAVHDEGIGIDAALLPGLFDLFVQGDQDIDRRQGGLGLGLTIVRQLVEMHQGRVTAMSNGPDRGSTFMVELPLAEPQEAAAVAGPPNGEAAGVPSGLKVLIVDDNRDGAQLLAAALTDGGCGIEVAHDGAAALEKAEAFGPQVALLDIGLPAMDGYELAQRLRERFDDGLRLVAITGYGQAEDRDRALAAGFDEHLVKPVDVDRLLALLAGS